MHAIGGADLAHPAEALNARDRPAIQVDPHPLGAAMAVRVPGVLESAQEEVEAIPGARPGAGFRGTMRHLPVVPHPELLEQVVGGERAPHYQRQAVRVDPGGEAPARPGRAAVAQGVNPGGEAREAAEGDHRQEQSGEQDRGAGAVGQA